MLLQSSPFLKYMGNTVVAWLLGEQAMLAADKLAALGKGKDDPEGAFYDSKVKVSRFFFKNLLPENRSLCQGILSEDTSALDVVL